MNTKITGDKNTILSVEEYLNKIRPYLKGIINNFKKSDTWKIQLTITINFASSKDDDHEEHLLHSENDNIEIMISDELDEVMKKLFDLIKKIYQNKRKVVSLSSIMFRHCIINVIK